MPAAEPRRRGDRRADRLDELQRRLDRRLRAAAHDRARDRPGVALLAEVAQRARQTALVPLADELARGQLLLGVHAHVQRRLVGVGEAALARIDLHRGHAQVEVRRVGLHSLLREQLQCLGIARANEAQRAADVLGELLEARSASGSRSIAISVPDDPSRSATRRACPPSPNVQSITVWPGAGEQPEQLAGEHRDVPCTGRGLPAAAQRAPVPPRAAGLRERSRAEPDGRPREPRRS